jgi:hypothetical protein
MPVYLIYIDDRRYSAPQIDSLEAVDDARAIAKAQARLAASPHYRAAELWEDERLVARLERPA